MVFSSEGLCDSVWSQFCQVCLTAAENAYEFTSELDIELDFGEEGG